MAVRAGVAATGAVRQSRSGGHVEAHGDPRPRRRPFAGHAAAMAPLADTLSRLRDARRLAREAQHAVDGFGVES